MRAGGAIATPAPAALCRRRRRPTNGTRSNAGSGCSTGSRRRHPLGTQLVAVILSCVFVSKSLASCRSRNWLDASPERRLTMRPRRTAGPRAAYRPSVERSYSPARSGTQPHHTANPLRGPRTRERWLCPRSYRPRRRCIGSPPSGGQACRAGASPPSRNDRSHIRSWSAHKRRNGRSLPRDRARAPSARTARKGTRRAERRRSAGRRRTSPRGRQGSIRTRRRGSASDRCDPSAQGFWSLD